MDETKEMCAYCGKPAEGHGAIHRDGFGIGPEVDLCDACGLGEEPTCEAIWARIAQPEPEAPPATVIDLFAALKGALGRKP